MQPNVTKQVKPSLQQTASPALRQQIEPKELKAPKRLQQHKLLQPHLVCLIHNTQHTITMVIGGSNGRSDPMGDTEILIMLSIGHGLTIIQQRPSTNEHCNPSLLATIYCL